MTEMAADAAGRADRSWICVTPTQPIAASTMPIPSRAMKEGAARRCLSAIQADHGLGDTGPSAWKGLADPTRFERATFAFGGH
ncbi:MAG TPA: hypothetical protein VE684_20685 [Crenalkalicoccus sp.]|nr:hypothetical protein [Crenalkalicoccus sp.]